MEFVRFQDYDETLGTRVSEGWGSVKDTSYDGLLKYQGDDEKRVQEEQIFFVKIYQIPSNNEDDDDLKKKYPIKFPTTYYGKNADKILNIILEGFDKWNTGINEYIKWVQQNYDSNAISVSPKETNRTVDEYIQEMIELCNDYEIKKNILIIFL